MVKHFWTKIVFFRRNEFRPAETIFVGIMECSYISRRSHFAFLYRYILQDCSMSMRARYNADSLLEPP